MNRGRVRLWGGFVVRSLGRHRVGALTIFLAVTALSVFVVLLSPKTYTGSMVLQARPAGTVSAAAAPGAPNAVEAPAVLADSTIRTQANLEKISDYLQLVERHRSSKGPLTRLASALTDKISGGAGATDKRGETVADLRKAIDVATVPEEQVKQTIRVNIVWNDPQQAKEILEAVNRNYFADARLHDVGQLDVSRQVLASKLADQNIVVDKLRAALNDPIDDDRILAEASPISQELLIQSTLAQRFSDADAELKTAEGSFALRYATISPAEVAEDALSRSLKPIIVGLALGLLLAALVSTLTDIRRGKVVESWQVTRHMNLPLLAKL